MHSKTNDAEVVKFLQCIGAIEVKVEEAETGWWLGTYDKQTKPFEHKETAALV